jgi:quercetin dioxygenase-like cupin family protein
VKVVQKGWGYEKWICNSKDYCGKLLFFNKGKRSSFHYHKLKDETFYIQSGKVLLKHSNSDKIEEVDEIILNTGDSFHIDNRLRHQIVALEETELIEFSTEHFDSDSHRIIKGD